MSSDNEIAIIRREIKGQNIDKKESYHRTIPSLHTAFIADDRWETNWSLTEIL